MLREAVEQQEALAHRRKLAADYAAGREDARDVLRDLERPQREGSSMTSSAPSDSIHRGDIVWVNSDPSVGAEPRKTHTCVVVSNDIANR